MEQKLFLLGGHDLEMLAIRSLLEKNHIPYKDHALSWHNAYLSMCPKCCIRLNAGEQNQRHFTIKSTVFQ